MEATFRPEGLTADEASSKGQNVLPSRKAPSLLAMLARQFVSPLIYILVAAGAFSAAIGEWVDAGFIGLVLLLNALIGGIQEWRAERGAQALRRMLQIKATVVRDGRPHTIDAADIVLGDTVLLEPGQAVPADVALAQAPALELDESTLTGESLPVARAAGGMAYAGTHVVRGRGKGTVVAIGTQTKLGRIATDVEEASQDAPLVLRMRKFARTVAVVVVAAALLLLVVGLVRGESAREMVVFAVAAAVSAVPEGLVVALTVALAVAATRMARRKVIVRRLAAVEGLGSCTMVATDKTGTLTMNRITVAEVRTDAAYGVTEHGVQLGAEPVGPGRDARLDALAVSVALCNEAHFDPPAGDPTETALLEFTARLGHDVATVREQAPQDALLPFEPERRFAASLHAGTLHVKGAPEVVLPMCGQAADPAVEAMAAAGMRVLAVARGPAEALPVHPEGLELLGFVGMRDPPRPGVDVAIRDARAAGVQIVMVTGDHPTTARSIAQAVGIDTQHVLTGEQLDAADAQAIARTTVFARVEPHQKLQIVQAAQGRGHFVAVTGDGVNDAPALKAAHIGVAMGSGTDVAREAADIVITDDAFPSVVAGIEEGRVAYGNVRNVVFLLVSTGAAELVLLLLALFTGSPVPLLPAQLLWMNLVTNGIQDVALGMEPGKGDEMRKPPRDPKERIFNRLMIERTILGAVVMGCGAFLVFKWLLAQGWEVPAARNAILLLLVLYENVHVGNCRSETRSLFSLNPLRNPFLLWGVAVAQLLHMAALYIPFMQKILRTEPVSLTTWFSLLAVALTVSLAFEAHKWWRRA